MELTKEQIESIAEELNIGMRVFVNLETKEIRTIMDLDDDLLQEELEGDEINEIENNLDKYLEFYKMDSREAFRVMSDFVDSLDNEKLKDKLDLGLSLSKPFRNFKDIIDSEGGEYRDKWFAFREMKYIEYVQEQLENYNNKIDEDI
jgi:hypothetical protein